LQTYIEHVESLDPKDDEGPLRDFTKKWLSRSRDKYLWPTSADPRLQTFMHINNFYDSEIEDIKELPLVNCMRYGTEIEQVQPQEYIILKERILKRVKVLAEEMQEKKIITYVKGRLQMVKAFREVWNERRDYWAKKAASSSINNSTDIYDTLELYDDDEDDCVPPAIKKKATSKGKQPMIQTKVLKLSCFSIRH
jgi:hypothetical protein